MTAPLSKREKLMRQYDRATVARTARLQEWMEKRDAEELELLTFLVESFESAHSHGKLAVISNPAVDS